MDTNQVDQAEKTILVLGRAGMDLYPEPQGVGIADATSYRNDLGGSAANIAVASRRAGCCADLLSCIADDGVGDYVLKQLQHYGVGTKHLVRAAAGHPNSLALAEQKDSAEVVIYRHSAADLCVDASQLAAVDASAYAAIVVTGTALSNAKTSAALLDWMRSAATQTLVCLDIDYRPAAWSQPSLASQVMRSACDAASMVVGNEEEFALLASDGFAFAQALRKPHGVVYKRGARGCLLFEPAGASEIGTYAVQALKPFGAGDAFLGNLLASLLQGASLAHAARRGAAAAAYVVARAGCASAMPSSEQLQPLIATTPWRDYAHSSL